MSVKLYAVVHVEMAYTSSNVPFECEVVLSPLFLSERAALEWAAEELPIFGLTGEATLPACVRKVKSFDLAASAVDAIGHAAHMDGYGTYDGTALLAAASEV